MPSAGNSNREPKIKGGLVMAKITGIRFPKVTGVEKVWKEWRLQKGVFTASEFKIFMSRDELARNKLYFKKAYILGRNHGFNKGVVFAMKTVHRANEAGRALKSQPRKSGRGK